jgi:hypothetical protein
MHTRIMDLKEGLFQIGECLSSWRAVRAQGRWGSSVLCTHVNCLTCLKALGSTEPDNEYNLA